MTKFPGISSLLTQAPQNHINTFESESTRSYKTGGKRERRRFDFRGRAKIVRTNNVFRAPHFSGGSADRLTMVYSFSVFLPFPLIIHTSGTKKGVLFSF